LGSGPDSTPFGTAEGVIGQSDIAAEGVALGVGYGYRGWQLDLGVTPVNFAHPTMVGGLRWKQAFRDVALTLEISRRAVEEVCFRSRGSQIPPGASGVQW
jgi:hypothetical protein